MKNIIICLLILTGSACRVLAQNKTQQKLQPLKIGDKVPDVFIDHIYKYKTTSANLADFKGKILILDFWATWCTACLEDMPRVDSLQKRFKDDVVILPVTDQKLEVLIKPFTTLPSLKNISLPTVYLDKQLSALFPARTLPHEIIIDKDGTVLAITDNYDVNVDNIEKIIKNQHVNFFEKKTDMVFNGFFADSIRKNLLLTYGVLGGYLDGFEGKTTRVPSSVTKKDIRVFGTNAEPVSLYVAALLQKLTYVNKRTRVIVNARDSDRFILPKGYAKVREWSLHHLLSFDFKVAENLNKSAFELMHETLDNYFQTTSRIEKRLVDCYVFKTVDSLKFKAKAKEYISDKATAFWTFHSRKIPAIITLMDDYLDLPVVNETNYSGLVDMAFKPAFNDIKTLKSELYKNGISLSIEKREMDMFVIEDRK